IIIFYNKSKTAKTMKFEDFKSGTYKQQYEYKTFSPIKINQTWTWEDGRINTLLAEANRQLGALNAYSEHVPDIDIFIGMYVTREAVQSSKIEGTQTNTEEVLKQESEIAPERKDDWQEVQNYIQAMNASIKELKSLTLSRIKFFLVGIIETSEKGIKTFKSILKLKEQIEEEKLITLGTRMTKGKSLMRYLYKKPVVTAGEIKEQLDVSLPTANSFLADFVRLKILHEKTGWKRNREFEFTEYLDLFRG
ncbi:MAG TPA: Fic/DOC family N-terminal domain-containing protein, partial [Ignavibacteriaceae bacterium]|nr:Fic/DOC family N-terminal domain-containing protein [Ignavibacteriaceae bacterium]